MCDENVLPLNRGIVPNLLTVLNAPGLSESGGEVLRRCVVDMALPCQGPQCLRVVKPPSGEDQKDDGRASLRSECTH